MFRFGMAHLCKHSAVDEIHTHTQDKFCLETQGVFANLVATTDRLE